MSFQYDCLNHIITLDNNTKAKLNNANEFEINNEIYVLFNLPMSLRVHTNIFMYNDKLFKTLAYIKKEKLLEFITNFINLSQYNFAFAIQPTKNITDTLNDIRQSTQELVTSSKILDSSYAPIFKIILKLFENLDAAVIETRIFSSVRIKFVFENENITAHELLTIILEYLLSIVNYTDPSLYKYKPLCTSLNLLYTMMYFNLLIDITIGDNFTDKDDIIIHSFISLMYDLVTDKCGRELYQSNDTTLEGVRLFSDIKQKFPIITKINSINTYHQYSQHLMPYLDYIAINNQLTLHPFLISYNMSDKERLMFLFNDFKEKLHTQAKNNKESLDKIPLANLTFQSYIDVLELIISSYNRNTYSRYNLTNFDQIIDILNVNQNDLSNIIQ